MSIEKEKGLWVIQCDNCDETYETEQTDKEEALQDATNMGWLIKKNEHLCEQCAEEENAA